MTPKGSPCGPWTIPILPAGLLSGPATTVAPSSVALARTASVCLAWNHVSQWGGF